MTRNEWRERLRRHVGELFVIQVKARASERHGGMPGRIGGGYTINHYAKVTRVCLIDDVCLDTPDSTILIAKSAILVTEGTPYRFDDKALGLANAIQMRPSLKLDEQGTLYEDAENLTPSRLLFSRASDGIREMDVRLPTQLLEDPQESDVDSKIVTREKCLESGARYSTALVIGNENVIAFFKKEGVFWADTAVLAFMKDAPESARAQLVKAGPYLDQLFHDLDLRRKIIDEFESEPDRSHQSGPDGKRLGYLRKRVLEAVAILEQIGCGDYPIIAYAKRVLAMIPDAVPYPTRTGEPDPVIADNPTRI